jgi:hypothetical protein
MSQCEISASDQSVTTDSAAANHAAAPSTPVAVDAPGIAPVDPSAGADKPVIDLEPIVSVTHWTSPNTQGGPKGSSSWRPAGAPGATARRWQAPRFPRLAAAIALAIAGGAVAGSVGTLWITRADQNEQALSRNETSQLKSVIERLNSDLTAMRSSVESSNRGTSTQFARLAERIEKVERSQAEPSAKIAKINETLDRLDRRTRDLPDLPPVPERISAPVPIKEIPRVSIVPGWVVRSVYDGMALIQGRIGLVEVEVGDPLPGGGRVEAIRRQEGRWVVVTSKGLILAAQ